MTAGTRRAAARSLASIGDGTLFDFHGRRRLEVGVLDWVVLHGVASIQNEIGSLFLSFNGLLVQTR